MIELSTIKLIYYIVLITVNTICIGGLLTIILFNKLKCLKINKPITYTALIISIVSYTYCIIGLLF